MDIHLNLHKHIHTTYLYIIYLYMTYIATSRFQRCLPGIVVEPTELSAITMTRAVLVPLHAVLLAADAVQACSNVTVSLAASTGFARRHRV